MYTIETNIELPIAHCLYRGAYSGLCCGNVYRDLKNDGEKDRYELGDKVIPVIHAHSYQITVSLKSNKLDKNGMVVDFKKMKKIIHNYFDKYYNSTILTPDNPLAKLYMTNFIKNGISEDKFENQGLFIWNENPTAEYMSKYWYDALKNEFKSIDIFDLSVTVEETLHNKVIYFNNLII